MEYLIDALLEITVSIADVVSVLMVGSTPVKVLRRQNGNYNLFENR